MVFYCAYASPITGNEEKNPIRKPFRVWSAENIIFLCVSLYDILKRQIRQKSNYFDRILLKMVFYCAYASPVTGNEEKNDPKTIQGLVSRKQHFSLHDIWSGSCIDLDNYLNDPQHVLRLKNTRATDFSVGRLTFWSQSPERDQQISNKVKPWVWPLWGILNLNGICRNNRYRYLGRNGKIKSKSFLDDNIINRQANWFSELVFYITIRMKKCWNDLHESLSIDSKTVTLK